MGAIIEFGDEAIIESNRTLRGINQRLVGKLGYEIVNCYGGYSGDLCDGIFARPLREMFGDNFLLRCVDANGSRGRTEEIFSGSCGREE